MSATDTTPRPNSGPWFANAVGSIDQYGRKAWIALMVLAFMLGGPLGLIVLGFILVTGRFKRSSYPHLARQTSCSFRTRNTTHHMSRASGNTAFDAYKADTIARLEQEQADFEAFLIRLRESRDKAEFDQYLDNRAKEADGEIAQTADKSADKPAPGAY